jgi:L-alanine-DL-glutamate epimerase-like enolase superfamily enzyme
VILTDLTAGIIRIPLKTPFVTALRRVDAVESVRVTLTTAAGETGTGEAPPTRAITGEDCTSILAALAAIRPALLHAEFPTVDAAVEALHGALEGNYSAKAAVDMALYDLFAREAGMPLCVYLGGIPAPLRSDVTVSLNPPATMGEDASKAVQNGCDILKVKLGGRDGRDVERLRAVRRAAGDDAVLLVDANQAWDEEEALAFIKAVEPLGVTLIEQPVPADAFESMRRITARSPIPILADESVFSLEEARRVIDAGAADMVNIKLMKCGGIHRARKIIELCRDRGVPCMMGSMLEGPVSIAAALHLAMAYPETVRWHDLDSPLLYRELPPSAPVRADGNLLSVTGRAGI